jgi:hypothetical protein
MIYSYHVARDRGEFYTAPIGLVKHLLNCYFSVCPFRLLLSVVTVFSYVVRGWGGFDFYTHQSRKLLLINLKNGSPIHPHFNKRN